MKNFFREIQKIKCPALRVSPSDTLRERQSFMGKPPRPRCLTVFVNEFPKRLSVLMPSLEGWATTGHFITGKCLRQLTFSAFVLTTFISAGAMSLPSLAAETQEQAMVRRVPISVATGQRGEKLTTIYLLPGYGVNLSFIPTRETVQKVWFDNPAIASLDVDGCLEGLGRKCEQEGASVLHLRSIKPMKIPGLPKTNSSLLTVIANGSNGRRVYLFRVVAAHSASATNHVHMVEVFPDAASSPSIPTPLSSPIGAQGDFNQMRRGLMVALNRRLITENSVLWNRIVSFLGKVRLGEPLSQAAQTSGISLQLVAKLQEFGNISNSNLNSTVNNTSIQKTEILLR